MIRRQAIGALLMGCLFPLALAGTPAAAGNDATPATAHISYLTSSSVYVDVGRLDGVLQGDAIEVVREGQVIATLGVVYLSAHRASCSIVSASATPVVGDLVRYVPHREATPPPGSKEAETGSVPPRAVEPPAHGGLARLGVRGRVGVRYLEVKDLTGNDNGFSQPALDLRIDGYAIGGGPVDVLVDVRSHRTSRNASAGGTENVTDNRAYRASAAYHIDTRQQIVVGRQFAPALSVLSIFDGVLYSHDGARTGWGVFSGVQPDATDLGFSTDIQEHGAYVQFKNAPEVPRFWMFTAGVIGSYTQQTVNREFVYFQAQYTGPRGSAYLTQEVDYNRAWKVEEAGEKTFSPTGTFANMQFRASQRLTFYTGYDNRRNIRLYRDRVTPVTQFDDSHRQGAWAGTSLRIGQHWFTSADARESGGGPSGRADGYSASLGVDGLTRQSFGVRGRSTRYSNDMSEGWLHSVSTGLNLGQHVHLEVSGGKLQETNLTDPTLDRSSDWKGVDLDVLLGRQWYWLLSGERNRGNLDNNDQLYTSVTYRF